VSYRSPFVKELNRTKIKSADLDLWAAVRKKIVWVTVRKWVAVGKNIKSTDLEKNTGLFL